MFDPDPPYITNAINTGYPDGGCQDESIECAEDRLTQLEDERRTVEELELLDKDFRDEALDCYDEEIKKCERDIAYWKGEAY